MRSRDPWPEYRARIGSFHNELGISPSYAQDTGLPLQLEASELASVGEDIHGRPQRVAAHVEPAWRELCDAARRDGVELQLVSAYRSVEYQCQLIRRKLETGQDIAAILCVNAAPGYSEHHTGCALDLTTPGSQPLEEEFEFTEAFRWLCEHAESLGWRLSYPRDNAWGIDYEPWHWAFSDQG